jgi:uncharacterized protein YndB with AHSA1/START domain
MLHFQHTLTIRRPPPEVFAFLMAAENNPAWQPSLLDAGAVTPGPVQVGWRFREQRRILGAVFETEFVVEEYDPPHHCRIKAISGLTGLTARYLLHPTHLGTTLTAVGAVHERFVPRFAARGICRTARRELAGNLALLKQLLEATPETAETSPVAVLA